MRFGWLPLWEGGRVAGSGITTKGSRGYGPRTVFPGRSNWGGFIMFIIIVICCCCCCCRVRGSYSKRVARVLTRRNGLPVTFIPSMWSMAMFRRWPGVSWLGTAGGAHAPPVLCV